MASEWLKIHPKNLNHTSVRSTPVTSVTDTATLVALQLPAHSFAAVAIAACWAAIWMMGENETDGTARGRVKEEVSNTVFQMMQNNKNEEYRWHSTRFSTCSCA